MVSDVNLLVIQKHAIDSFNGAISSLRGFIVNKSITLGTAVFVGGNLARENISERRERVM